MRKLLTVVLLVVAALCFADGFDDMPYPNPDFMTYFQQEMTSLIRFQTENSINVPIFLSASMGGVGLDYKSQYISDIYSGFLDEFSEISSYGKGDLYLGLVGGFQFRPHRAVYIPLVFAFTYARDDYIEEGPAAPREQVGSAMSFFAGSGVVINTDIVRGGIYAGYGLDYPMFFAINRITDEDFEDAEYYRNRREYRTQMFKGFKIVLVPLVNTSSWKLVGYALNSILGYLDTGNLIKIAAESEDKGDSTASAIANTINAGLDFTFKQLHFGPVSLKANAIYSRGSYDAAAKNDIYGLRIQGQFPGKPWGFSLEGGYKNFFAMPQWLEKDYPGTGYFNGSVYYALKRVTLGVIYRYDNIYKSKFTLAVSTDFLSGLFSFNPPEQYMDKDKYFSGQAFDFGLRYRHGAWNAGKE